MSTNQPLSGPSALPVIEAILGAVPPVVVIRPTAHAHEQTDGWNTIEERIADWAPPNDGPEDRVDEDGYRLPNRIAVAVALGIASRLREAGVCLPLRTGQTANGGINFEWRSENRTERLTVNARGETEVANFEDSMLVSRKKIHFGASRR